MRARDCMRVRLWRAGCVRATVAGAGAWVRVLGLSLGAGACWVCRLVPLLGARLRVLGLCWVHCMGFACVRYHARAGAIVSKIKHLAQFCNALDYGWIMYRLSTDYVRDNGRIMSRGGIASFLNKMARLCSKKWQLRYFEDPPPL